MQSHCRNEHRTYLQSDILVLYGMAKDSLEGKFLPSLAIFHKVDSAEATLRNLTHHLVPGNSWSSFDDLSQAGRKVH